MLERDRLIEIAVAVTAVFVMLGVMLWIGFTYGGENGLSEEGSHLLIGAIVGFIFLLTAVGVGLAIALNDPEDGVESDGSGADDAETKPAA